ncbi:MAG TPA: hypothetical protein DEA46_03220, partial [Candidatus Moranbacteria bacterium]|nr:hypothetical protein [Candidatus Moranbacteria bacterium]
MKASKKLTLILSYVFLAGIGIVFISFSKVVNSAEENETEVAYTGDISSDLTIQKDQKVFFDGETNIVDGKTLTIEEGAEITFRGYYSSLNVIDGKIEANGTANKKIIFKRENADTNYSIFFNSHDYQSSFRYVNITEGGAGPFGISRNFINKFLIKTADAYFYSGASGDAAIEINGGKLHMENCEFIDTPFQDIKINPEFYYNDPNEEDDIDGTTEAYLSEVEIININFSIDRALEAEQCDDYFDMMEMPWNSDRTFCKEKVYLKNDYYGDADGPNIDINGEEEDPEKGFYLKGDFNLDGWSGIKFVFEAEAPEVSGASSVLFLPGIKASHLYKYKGEENKLDELWLPNWFGNDVEELELDSDGKSEKNVFVKDGGVFESAINGDIYKSFIGDLAQLKTDQIIDDYKAFAYDWRQSVEDIAKNGTPYQFGTDKIQAKRIEDEINSLAQNSKSGKVTIVAHSNGGLVAKSLMAEHPELADKVDKIILVASPQMGTPLATLSMLYGYEESIPTLLSQKKARTLIENMPGAYGLLPSAEYLTRQRDAGDALINFSSENSERGKMFKEAYGDNIDELGEFREFLLAKKDHREKPETDEIDLENILNEKLLDESIAIYNNLDSWTPPAGVKVIQLGGWGLPTVSGIEYKDKMKYDCKLAPPPEIYACYETNEYELIPEPKWTDDGDEVVTTPSALTMPEIENVERYWLDIKRGKFKIEHKNILENANTRDFIKNEIQNNGASLPEYISAEMPADFEGMKPRIQMALYSPLDIHLYDSSGNHTGYAEINTDEGKQEILEENIPNSYYLQLGERKYVGFEEGEDVKIKLDGYGEGPYTLKIEEVRQTENGEELINSVTFKNLPTSEKTEVELTIPASGLENISNLKADYDGDKVNDYTLVPVMGGEATLPDVTPPTIEISSPENKTYLKNEKLDIAYLVSSDGINQNEIVVEKYLDNQLINQDKIDLSLLKAGEHKLIIKATDEIGNQSVGEVIFNVNTNIEILEKNVNHFYDLRLIKSSQERKMLINNLSVIEREIEFYNSIKNNIFLKSKVKKLLLSIMERQIENHIDIVIAKIKQDRKNY